MSKEVLLEEKLYKKMATLGWREPSPIQKKAIPVVLRKKSALLVAPTGSGKTEAAVLPIFSLLSSEGSRRIGVRMLYITPLRALNRDIFRRVIQYASEEGLRADVRHGDTPSALRQRMAKLPPDVLITTPETLAILLASKLMKLHLKSVEWVVVDELHELLGSKRGAHLSLSLERLEAITKKDTIRVGLSATVGDLKEAAEFLVGKDRSCAILVDPSIRSYDVRCEYVRGTLIDVARRIIKHIEDQGPRSVLLFTNTRDEAEYLATLLKREAPHIPIDVHHGSLSREVREEAEARLRAGEAGLVLSTSSLELGIDIGVADLVVQMGSARQSIKLAQRVGRSRHRVGEEAKGLVVTNRLDDELETIALIKRIERCELEKSVFHKGALDVLAHHLVGFAIEKRSYRPKDVLGLIRKSKAFEDVTEDDVDSCLRLLERQGVLRYDGEVVRTRGERTYEYYFENVSTIPDVQHFDVVDTVHKRKVGSLDQLFVGEHGEPGRAFVLKGSSWRIVSIDDERRLIHVEPVPTETSQVPYWVGELIPVDFHTAQMVGRMRRAIIKSNTFDISQEQKDRLLDTYRLLGSIPDDRSIVVEAKRGVGALVLHGCFGTKVNQTIATLLSTILSSKVGYIVEAKADAYRVLLFSQGSILPKDIVEVLNQELDVGSILSVAVKGTHMLNWRVWYVAKRFGVVEKDATYDRNVCRLIQERYADTPLYKEALRELFLEKYDVERTEEVLSMVRKGEVRVVERTLEDFTPLAKPILEYAASFTALPLSLEKTILESVKERLLNTRHRLVCLSCGWERVVRTKDVDDKVVCPICRSRIVSRTYVDDEGLAKTVQKAKKRALSKDEEAELKKAWKVSSLLQTFGKLALFVLSGFGVGPDTAARILRGQVSDEEELLRSIYKAEKLYVSTRGFWEN